MFEDTQHLSFFLFQLDTSCMRESGIRDMFNNWSMFIGPRDKDKDASHRPERTNCCRGKAHKGTLPGFMIEEKKNHWKHKDANTQTRKQARYICIFISNKANSPRFQGKPRTSCLGRMY